MRGIGHSRTFKKHVHLSVVKRQKDKSFLNLLKRIRNGKITKKDWKKLLTRNPQVVKKPDDYDSIIRLFGRNASVHDFNQRRLQQAVKNQIPIAKMVAEHYGDKKAEKAAPEDMWGLLPVLYLCRGASVMLNQNLLPAEYGLVNGAQGSVIDILYVENTDRLPKSVIVDFPGYTGPHFFKDHPTWVPIVPFTAQMENSVHSRRTQLPLRLAFAITVHKSQGLTLERAVVDLENRENKEGGLTYVALSRLKTFDGLFLQPPTWPRLQQINNRVITKQRVEQEEPRLMKLHKLTIANLRDC